MTCSTTTRDLTDCIILTICGRRTTRTRQDRIAAGQRSYTRIRQVAPMYSFIYYTERWKCATWKRQTRKTKGIEFDGVENDRRTRNRNSGFRIWRTGIWQTFLNFVKCYKCINVSLFYNSSFFLSRHNAAWSQNRFTLITFQSHVGPNQSCISTLGDWRLLETC